MSASETIRLPGMEKDVVLTLAAVAKGLPRMSGGKPVASSTVLRWILHGVRTRSGQRVKLPAVRIGVVWGVKPVALAEFFEQLAVVPDDSPAQAPRTAAQQRRRNERVDKELFKRAKI